MWTIQKIQNATTSFLKGFPAFKVIKTPQKPTFFSSFLGGRSMVSFAGERRSTVEQSKRTMLWVKSKTRTLLFTKCLFWMCWDEKAITTLTHWNIFRLALSGLIYRKNNWIKLISSKLHFLFLWASSPPIYSSFWFYRKAFHAHTSHI